MHATMKPLSILPVALVLLAAAARAEVVGNDVAYTAKSGDELLTFEGYAAWDVAVPGKRPGVLVVHAWRGLDDFAKEKARELAKMGYVAFAVDMYGKGVRAKDDAEAAKLAGGFYRDRALMRERARAGLEILRKMEEVDASRVGAIGFCFGGTVVLELGRAGEDLRAVVSFHGGLQFPDPPKAEGVRARVLVCHGADDPHVPPEQVLALWKELQAARARYEILVLSGAVHAFTDPAAGDDPSRGAAYQPEAARTAWHAMAGTFAEALAR
jgi:dienelactone hydrolase